MKKNHFFFRSKFRLFFILFLLKVIYLINPSDLHAKEELYLMAGGGGALMHSSLERTHIPAPGYSDAAVLGGGGGLLKVGAGAHLYFAPQWFIGVGLTGRIYSLKSKITERTFAFINNKTKHIVHHALGIEGRIGFETEGQIKGFLSVSALKSRVTLESESMIIPGVAKTTQHPMGIGLGFGVYLPIHGAWSWGVEMSYDIYKRVTLHHTNTAGLHVRPRLGSATVCLQYSL